MLPKLYLGPMSKNIVDSIIRLNSEGYNIGLIPSRRQIDYMGGYVNGWKTSEFSNYVWSHNINITLCRDHAGAHQGKIEDDGVKSLIEDCNYFDIIHIDPWKLDVEFSKCLQETVRLMKICYERNPRLLFEIGTEEGIKHLSTEQVYELIKYVKDHVSFFDSVSYVVIQSGTNLSMDKNTGNYSELRLIEMCQMVHKEFGLLTKEHNGDYLDNSMIQSKFDKGLDAINIAPEIGRMETECYLSAMSEEEINKFFDICYKSKAWVKWLKNEKNFNPIENKEKIMKICGHYNFSDSEFKKMTEHIDIKEELYCKIKDKVIGILGDKNGNS